MSGKNECRVNEGYMRQSLWKVSDQSFADWIVLLREQAGVISNVTAVSYRVLQLQPCVRSDKGSRPSKSCRPESSFSARQAITCGPGVVTLDETVLHQVLFNRGNCATNARVVRRQKPDEHNAQAGRIELR